MRTKRPRMIDLPTLIDRISEPEGFQAKSVSMSSGSSGNHLFFYEDVDAETIASLNKDLREGAVNLKRTFAEWEGEVTPPPLHLHIHSYGGDLMAGFAAGETIRMLSAPVHTHIEGGAGSAATVISISGVHRTITQRSFILIHEIRSEFWGKQTELEDHKDSMDRMMKVLHEFYAERTKLPKARLKEVLKRDIWFTASEALEYGLVDEVI